MKLIDVEVDKPQSHVVRVGGYFGKRRVIYEIPREPLDDYFRDRPNLTDLKRHTLVTSNLETITAVMQQKCEQQQWRETDRGTGPFWLLDFDARDLKLSDHQLVAEEMARAEHEAK
ncbi:hypothetical protein ACQR09_25080 [Bradyrhizobium oligotrophicum]|uniref:hypothetical protein n=1 Tax=Bradyrhizobium oligotrophicum TaxID=44255 RepID=UPI003EB8F6E5